MLIYTSDSIVIPLCITSRRITQSQSQNTVTITFPVDREHQGAVLYLLLHPSFCPLTYIAPMDCSISINIAKPVMDVAHCFFHCNKEPCHSTLFVTSVTGRLHFEKLQQRCYVVGTFVNLYIEQLPSSVTHWEKNCGALLFGQPLYIKLRTAHSKSKLWCIWTWKHTVLHPSQCSN
jgi:hypothetical protein